MESRRVVWREKGVVEVETFEPPAPGDGQVLLRARATLVSPGTERAFFLGLPNADARFPQTPGYSFVGKVVEVGAGVSEWGEGDRVALEAPHAMHAVVPASRCVRVPDGLPDEDAVFFNLAAIALGGVRKARIEIGEAVAVVGAGLIGLLAMQLSKINGAIPAVSIDRNPRRLEFAQHAGADAALPSDERLPGALRDLLGTDGAPVVIEATGHPDAVLLAFSLAAAHGRVVLLGSTRGETERVNFYRDVHRKGLTVIGAHNIARPPRDSFPNWWTLKDDQDVALHLLAARRLDVRPLLTHRFSWQDAPLAYELLKAWEGDALGMMLDWRDEGTAA